MIKKMLSCLVTSAIIIGSTMPAVNISAEENPDESTHSYIYNDQMTVFEFINAKRRMLSEDDYNFDDYKLIREFLLKRYSDGKFFQKKVAVSFDIEGLSTDSYSDPGVLDTKILYSGSTIKIPQHTLYMESCSHGGWWYNGRNYRQGESFTVPDENVVFTPYWNKYHIVTYLAGDYDDIVGQTMSTVQAMEGVGFDLADSSRFTRQGYTLAGWQCSLDDKVYGTSGRYTIPDSDVTFTAVWKVASVEISISANNGVVTDRIKDSANTGDEYPLPECTFTNGDKTFAGWKYNGQIYNVGDTITIPALLKGQKVVITAVWS